MMDETPVLRNETVKPKRSLRFKIGVFCLVINIPFGYGGAALAAAIGVTTAQPAIGVGLGVCIYILSWCMLGLGIWMTGPEGKQIMNDFGKKWSIGKKEPTGSTILST